MNSCSACRFFLRFNNENIARMCSNPRPIYDMVDTFISAEHFSRLGALLLRRAQGLNVIDDSRRFRALFGTTPSVCSMFWALMCGRCRQGSGPEHFLWTLSFLKEYATEHALAALACVDEKTVRKLQWSFFSCWQI